MTPARKQSTKPVGDCLKCLPAFTWSLAFLFSVIASTAVLKRLELSLTLKVLCVAVPLVFGAAFLKSTYELVRRSDELIRRMCLESLAAVAVGVWVLAFVAPVVERVGLVDHVDSSWYLTTISVLFIVGMRRSLRRYVG